MFGKIKTLRNDELTRNGTIMFISGIVSGGFNYIYQIYMGRALGPEQYGVFGMLFAIFYIVGIFSQTLSTSVTRFVSKYVGEGKNIGFFINKSIFYLGISGLIVTAIFLIFSNSIAEIFKLGDTFPLIIMGVILFITFIDPIYNGALRGLKKFKNLGLIGISNSFIKLISGIVFVGLGFGVGGALLGVTLGMVIALIMSVIFIKPYMLKNNSHESEFRIKELYLYSFPVLLAMVSYSVIGNLDVIMAKYFFSPIDAGIYTSVSVLGKIALFLPGAIGVVMFPMIAEKHIKGEIDDVNEILKKSIIYTGFLSGSVMGLYLIFPEIVVKIFGAKYVDAVGLVGYYGMIMFIFSIIGILLNYHLAIQNMKYIVGFFLFTIIEILLLMIFHYTMIQMMEVLLISNFIFLIMSMIYTFRGVVRIA